MIDMNANMTPMTVQMPADLIAEVRRVSGRTGMSVDELVQEACAQFVEPYEWEAVIPQRTRTDSAVPQPTPNGIADAPSAHP
jgi:metal-responsive CopG/Arc/MetJ family transcriptional regulator